MSQTATPEVAAQPTKERRRSGISPGRLRTIPVGKQDHSAFGSPEPGADRESVVSRGNGLSFRRQVTIVAVLLSLLSRAVCADDYGFDKVMLQIGAGNSRVVVTGTILDYTGTKLSFRSVAGSSIRTYPSEQVVSVETPQTKPHIEGLRSFAENRYEDAIGKFTAALKVENRSWVRREIRAMLIRCALRNGKLHSAAEQFAPLVESDPTTGYFKLIPLAWRPQVFDAKSRKVARKWLQDDTEAMRLIGASLLLGDAGAESTARRELRRLVTNTDPRIYSLAEAQLWRTRLADADIERYDLERWGSRIERTPVELRGGMYYLLGQGHLQLQEHEQAAMAMLWVPLVYDDDHYLAAHACLESADALAAIGQSSESVTLYREIMQRFRETPVSPQAVTRLNNYLKSPAKTNATTIQSEGREKLPGKQQ